MGWRDGNMPLLRELVTLAGGFLQICRAAGAGSGARAVPRPQRCARPGDVEQSGNRSSSSRAADGDRPRSGNAAGFIPLTMIPRTELAVGNATGRADWSCRNQMKANGAGKARQG